MKTYKIKVDFPIFRIVGNGIVSTPAIGEGRFVPSLIIDVENKTEVSELIKLHTENQPGDAALVWSKPNTFFKATSVHLVVDFLKPMNVKFAIEFNIKDDYSLIDGIIQSRGFYLQSGKAGDKISHFKNDSILIEVPKLDFDEIWKKMLPDLIRQKYRDKGASKKEAAHFAREHILKMREILNTRRPSE